MYVLKTWYEDFFFIGFNGMSVKTEWSICIRKTEAKKN